MLHDRLRERGGRLALADLPQSVQVVIDSIGLTSFFTVCDTVDDAASRIREGD
jgi:anti-anti-sigma regulatory factor